MLLSVPRKDLLVEVSSFLYLQGTLLLEKCFSFILLGRTLSTVISDSGIASCARYTLGARIAERTTPGENQIVIDESVRGAFPGTHSYVSHSTSIHH